MTAHFNLCDDCQQLLPAFGKHICSAAPPIESEQVERLAEDLRDHTAPEYIDGKPSATAFEHTLFEAADLLESQARQIATLTAENKEREEIIENHRAARKTLTAERDRAEQDAKRYRWLEGRCLAADFDYGERHESVIVFRWPKDARIGANLTAAIDAALAGQS